MSFGASSWLWALLIIPILTGLFLRAERRAVARLREFVSERLLPDLARTVDRRRRKLRFALLMLGLAFLIAALAQPRWGYIYEDVKRKGLDLIFAADTSRSMLSNDVAPSRLQRVKLAMQDLLNELQGDRVGLVAFAGRAFLQAPLTIDYSAAVEAVNDLDTTQPNMLSRSVSVHHKVAASSMDITWLNPRDARAEMQSLLSHLYVDRTSSNNQI